MMPKGKELVCGCGYRHSAQGSVMTEKAAKKEEIAVVKEEKSVNVIVDAECPKCHHKKAEYWEVQTRSIDEPPTRFHKCVKCSHTWREYK